MDRIETVSDGRRGCRTTLGCESAGRLELPPPADSSVPRAMCALLLLVGGEDLFDSGLLAGS